MGILGVILGIVAILCAVFATFFFGVTGGIIAGVLAAVAIVLGIVKRRKDGKGGIAAMVIGVLAIVTMLGLSSLWSSVFTELHNKAVEYKPDGMWAQVTGDVKGGMLGIIKNIPNDEASVNALIEEMNELNKLAEDQVS